MAYPKSPSKATLTNADINMGIIKAQSHLQNPSWKDTGIWL